MRKSTKTTRKRTIKVKEIVDDVRSEIGRAS
ncbi:MAG: hypothetical protein QG577_1984, partial [Thermodesulfobacteriota bacterium]|nr:hypothetical protein [Thermodesulfobacteriota bacterium]